jgi:DNA-binding NtrC family response regulator
MAGATTLPGNIRELRNLLERASLLSDGDTITPEHLLSDLARHATGRRTAATSTAQQFCSALRPLAEVEALSAMGGRTQRLSRRALAEGCK